PIDTYPFVNARGFCYPSPQSRSPAPMRLSPGLTISASSLHEDAICRPSDHSPTSATSGGFMTATVVGRLLVALAILNVSVASAQEATLGGAVTDSTGGVLPGVTLTAVHEATGNTFEGVTDERGNYRIAARTGVYKLTAVLTGFSTVTRSGLELL